MDLIISWGTILKLILAGLGTYIILPALLVLRDWLLWKVIEKFILNETLERLILMRSNDVWHLKNEYNYKRKVEINGKENKFFLNDEEVGIREFSEIEQKIEFHKRRIAKIEPQIIWRSNLINWLLRHYKQDGDKNPIPEWEKQSAQQIKQKLGSKSVEKPNNG